MGLGKTLSMISLILKASEMDKKSDYSDDTDSDIEKSLENPKFNST